MTDTDTAPVAAPFDGYDDLTAAEVVEHLGTLSGDDLAAVKAYERANENRKTVTGWTRPAAAPDREAHAPEGRPPLAAAAEAAAKSEHEQEPILDQEEK